MGSIFMHKWFNIILLMPSKTKKHKKQIKHAVWHIKHAVKLAVVPHSKNDYRPHLIRRYGLVTIFLVVVGLQFAYNALTTGRVLGRETEITISSLLYQTNLARTQANLAPLKLNSKLNKAAYLKVQDMFDKQYWAHDAPDGTKPWKWLGDAGYNYNKAGENLAKNFSTTNGVITAWLGSPEHKANVMNPDYQDVGFAVMDGDLNGEPTTLVVALYAQPEQDLLSGIASFSGASTSNDTNLLTQFAVAIQSITPAVMVGLSLIFLAIVVAGYAHAYRNKLPKALRKSWYRHHGIYKIAGLVIFASVLILAYSGGQI